MKNGKVKGPSAIALELIKLSKKKNNQPLDEGINGYGI